MIVTDWLFRRVFGFCMVWHIIMDIKCDRTYSVLDSLNHKKPMNTIDFQNPGLAFNYCPQDLCVHEVCTMDNSAVATEPSPAQ